MRTAFPASDTRPAGKAMSYGNAFGLISELYNGQLTDHESSAHIVLTIRADAENEVCIQGKSLARPWWGKLLSLCYEECSPTSANFFLKHRHIPFLDYEKGWSTGSSRPEEFSRFYSYLRVLKETEIQIAELSEDALEEESEGQSPLFSDSRLGLLSFLYRVSALDLVPVNSNLVPGLALTYGGNIRAEWRSSSDNKLVLEFLSSADLKFVFFYPDSHDPATVSRVSGNGSVLGFLDDYPRALEFLRSLSD